MSSLVVINHHPDYNRPPLWSLTTTTMTSTTLITVNHHLMTPAPGDHHLDPIGHQSNNHQSLITTSTTTDYLRPLHPSLATTATSIEHPFQPPLFNDHCFNRPPLKPPDPSLRLPHVTPTMDYLMCNDLHITD